jgi:hypothetical protein
MTSDDVLRGYARQLRQFAKCTKAADASLCAETAAKWVDSAITELHRHEVTYRKREGQR